MKKILSTDEYLQCLALLTLGKDLRLQSDRYADALERLLEISDGDVEDVWDMFFEINATPSRCLGEFLKDNQIKVDGPSSRFV